MLRRWSIVGAALALLMLVVVPAAAGPKGTDDRPFKADLVGVVELEFFNADCAIPDQPGPPLVTSRTAGTATVCPATP